MPKPFKILIGIAAVIAVALLVLSLGRQPQPFAEGSESAARLQPGSHTVRRPAFSRADGDVRIYEREPAATGGYRWPESIATQRQARRFPSAQLWHSMTTRLSLGRRAIRMI